MDKSKYDRQEETLHEIWDSIPDHAMSQESKAAFDRFCDVVDFAVDSQPSRASRLWNVCRNAAAALLVPVAAVCAFLYFSRPEAPLPKDVEWREYIAKTGASSDSLRLPDGSLVRLNAGSRLIYPDSFDAVSKRLVFLSGEGYFDVAKDLERQFVVSAGDLCVNVHGTRFNLTSYDGMETASVALLDGSVSLSVRNDSIARNLTLIPGDVAHYNRRTGSIEQGREPVDAYLSWMEGGFYFYKQTLENVTAHFEKIYGKKIYITDRTVATTVYTLAFVNGESLDTMLSSIAGNELKVQKSKDFIVISKK